MGKLYYRDQKVGCCEKACHMFNQIWLQLLNIVDFCLGCVLFTFGIYLHVNFGDSSGDQHIMWLAIFSSVLGGLLLLISFMSFCAIVSQECRCTVYVSSYLGLLASVIGLVSAVTCLILRDDFFNYLDAHYEDADLSNTDKDHIKQWYIFIVCGMFFVFVSEALRFKSSSAYFASATRQDSEYARLMDEDALLYQEEVAGKKVDLKSKYDAKREYYKDKYTRTVV